MNSLALLLIFYRGGMILSTIGHVNVHYRNRARKDKPWLKLPSVFMWRYAFNCPCGVYHASKKEQGRLESEANISRDHIKREGWFHLSMQRDFMFLFCMLGDE